MRTDRVLAIHLVDEVLPIKPIRQWVLSFPIQIRLLLAIRPKIMTEVLNIATSTISQALRKNEGFKKSQAKTGTVTLIQRFGGSINLNIHFHQLFLDGVYGLDDEKKPAAFHITKALTPTELSEVLNKIIHARSSTSKNVASSRAMKKTIYNSTSPKTTPLRGSKQGLPLSGLRSGQIRARKPSRSKRCRIHITRQLTAWSPRTRAFHSMPASR